MDPLFRDHFKWDMKRLANTPGIGDEIVECVNRAILDIMKEPEHAVELQYPPLKGYRSKHFFSTLEPPEGLQPDMRLIYRVFADELYLEAVGVPHPDEKEKDIYTSFGRFVKEMKTMIDPSK